MVVFLLWYAYNMHTTRTGIIMHELMVWALAIAITLYLKD